MQKDIHHSCFWNVLLQFWFGILNVSYFDLVAVIWLYLQMCVCVCDKERMSTIPEGKKVICNIENSICCISLTPTYIELFIIMLLQLLVFDAHVYVFWSFSSYRQKHWRKNEKKILKLNIICKKYLISINASSIRINKSIFWMIKFKDYLPLIK